MYEAKARPSPTENAMLNATDSDSEALELLLLDLLAEGDSPAEAAATLVDTDVADGSYAEGSRELETAFEHLSRPGRARPRAGGADGRGAVQGQHAGWA